MTSFRRIGSLLSATHVCPLSFGSLSLTLCRRNPYLLGFLGIFQEKYEDGYDEEDEGDIYMLDPDADRLSPDLVREDEVGEAEEEEEVSHPHRVVTSLTQPSPHPHLILSQAEPVMIVAPGGEMVESEGPPSGLRGGRDDDV